MLSSSLLTWQCDTYASLSQFEKTCDQDSCRFPLIILGNSVVSVLRLDSRSRASERRSSSSPSAVIRLVVVQGETLCWDSPPIVYQTP